MHQRFFLGHSAEGRRQELDTASFETLQQLRSSLGKSFAIAEPNSVLFHHKDHGALDTLQAVKSCLDPVELRVSPNKSIAEPPGPRALPLVGNHYELYPDPLGNLDRLFSRYGPIIKTVNMGTTIYQTNDPTIARFVLREGAEFTKTTSDPSHPLYYMQHQSSLFTCDSDSPAFQISHKFVPPALSPRAVAYHTPLIQEAARSIFPVLDQLSTQDEAFHVYHFMFKLAGQVIWRVVVNQDLNHFETVDTQPHKTIHVLGEWLHLMKKTSLRPKWYGSLPFGDPAKLRAAQRELWDDVEKAVDECTRSDNGTLPLSDPAASLRASCMADFLARARDEKGEALPRDIMISNVVILLGAGFTTSSSLLSWCIYSLVRYPGNQERLLQEVIDHGADGKRDWTYEDVHALKFLDCFVKEVQRVHNPSFQTARNARQDVVLPGGYLIPKGSIVIPCFPSMHKNPAHWDNPLKFDPDRWSPSDLAGKLNRKGLYTPFAAGRRGCVGLNLALMEVKTVLIELVYRYHFEDASREPIVYDPEFLVVRPINFYAAPIRRTEWPSRSNV
ncbi:Cytochrome P450 monooxygenase alnD [Paramyrothecium foliicola]|nr:Cytochrome P450 monooxygenase alnD [Paramyrothecium foliicola]